MANGQHQLAPAPMAANMFGKAPPPAGNPFSAPPSTTPAALNPFLAKAAAPPALGNPFGQASGLGTAPAPAPANPFQAAAKATAPAAPAPSQPAASPFSMFGKPSQAPAPTPSPFQAATQPPAAANPFSAPSTSTSSAFGGFSGAPAPAAANGLAATPAANPFIANTTNTTHTTNIIPSPFGAATKPAASSFGGASTTPAASPFGGSTAPAASPFGGSSTPAASPFGGSTAPAISPRTALASAKAAAKKSVHFNANPVSSTAPAYANTALANGAAQPAKTQNTFARFTPPAPAPPAPNQPASQSDYTKKILAQLQKDRISPPQWPADPGNPDKASAMEALWSAYDDYRSKARDSLVKAGLIDNPNVRKKLNEAIVFKGICEDMCPEFEKIERIYQHNVMMSEKVESPDGTMWPSPPIMVKALTRSSAGQEAPLPMDVRTVAALQRTLDYLIDSVLGDDESRLPSVHNFLWDRTRAIRRDFIFHSTMSEAEMQGQIYCLEVITRFHVTCLHLLSQKGVAPEGFDQFQERVQLSKALLSLLQAYDDCRDRQIRCANEAEFRAYFILLNAQDPNVQHRVSEWGTHLWYDSDDVQTAMTLAQAMQSVWDWRGPVRPAMPTTTALGAFATFFRIVESPRVSYTMACFAEAQFMHVRRGILRNMVRAYARTRDSPKDLTVAALNNMLRFDTLDEAWDFVAANGLAFSSADRRTAYLDLASRPAVGNEPLPQAFSRSLVERKRAGHSLPAALHTTVYETPGTAPPATTAPEPEPKRSESELFVSQTPTPTLAPAPAPARVPATIPPVISSASKLPPAKQTAPAASSIFSSTPAPSFFPSSTTPKPSAPAKTEAGAPALLFQPTAEAKRKPESTTPTTSPAKPAPTSNMFGPGAAAAPASAQPAAASSFANLFPAPTPTTAARAEAKTAPAPAPAPSSLFSAGTGTAPKPAETSKSIFSSAPTPTAPSVVFGAAAGKQPETSQQAFSSPPAPPAPSAPPAPPAPPAPSKTQLMDDFTKWFVLGDTGILGEFKEGFVEYLLQQTFSQHQRDEAERARREEDAASWAAALKFKTYNLRVKFFYRWRRIARERALDRRARQARDELKAYRAAKRAEQRRAAEHAAAQAAAQAAAAAAADERARAAEARRMGSTKEVRLLEEMGYTEFTAAAAATATARKRKALGDGERQRSASMSAVAPTPTPTPQEREHDFQKPLLPQPHAKLPVRHAIKDGISNISHTVSRAKEFVSSRMHRGSGPTGDGDSIFDDGASMSGDSVRSVRSIQSMRSMQSMRSNFSRVSRDSIGSNTNTSTVTYYRRSVPGKSRLHSIFTRVPSGSSTGAGAGAAEAPPKKVTNFMRYSSRGASTSRRPAAAVTGTTSPAPSDSGSKIKSSYWRLRAMGMVQMPNKQYLHESLALPMLQDGKRFRGVGNYGLPPVPPWDDAANTSKADDEMVDVHDDGDDAGPSSSNPETYAEEILRRTMGPGSASSSRKRVFSGSTGAADAGLSRLSSSATVTSPPGAKKARVEAAATAAGDSPTTEAERVIREMRELAAAMDEDRDWFKEQTALLQKGASAWDQ